MKLFSRVWWFTFVIPASKEVETERTMVQGQLREKVSETPSQSIN
jgi:hypothetical protein